MSNLDDFWGHIFSFCTQCIGCLSGLHPTIKLDEDMYSLREAWNRSQLFARRNLVSCIRNKVIVKHKEKDKKEPTSSGCVDVEAGMPSRRLSTVNDVHQHSNGCHEHSANPCLQAVDQPLHFRLLCVYVCEQFLQCMEPFRKFHLNLFQPF